MSEHVEATFSPRDAVEVVRAAAEVLREATRDLPRGPWHWGDPEVDDDRPGVGPVPRHESWPLHPPHPRPEPEAPSDLRPWLSGSTNAMVHVRS